MVPRSSSALWLGCLSGAFGLAITAQVNFLVPLRARELGASFDLIGLIVSAGALAPALLSVSTGAVVDRLGARRSFLLGTGASAVVSLLYLFVTSSWWLLAIQPLMGVARNLGWIASQGYLTSLGSERQRTRLAGRFGFFSNGGQMAGAALVGAVAQLVGFRWAFLFLAGYSASFAVIGLLLPDTRVVNDDTTRAKQGAGLRSALEVIRVRHIQAALLLSFGRLWISWVYMTFFPVYLIDNGFKPAVVGLVLATTGIFATVAAPSTGFCTHFLSQHTVAALGLVCGAMGLLVAPHLSTFPWVAVVAVLVGVGNGLSLPLLLVIVSTAAPAGKQGVALGLRASVNQVAASAAPAVAGPLIATLGTALGFTTAAAIAGSVLLGACLLQGTARSQGLTQAANDDAAERRTNRER